MDEYEAQRYNNRDSEKDLDANLIKLYEINMDQLNRISTIIQICQIIGYCSFLVFLILITIKVYPVYALSWFFVMSPALICLTSFTYQLNMYLRLKDIFDEAELKETGLNIGSILSYFCLNTTALSLFVYLVLFTLKSEYMISSQWNLITVPLYCIFGMALFYFVFIMPAFLQSNLVMEICLIFVYIATSLTFVIAINLKMDQTLDCTYLMIFIPLLSALFIHICCSFYNTLISKFSNQMLMFNFGLNCIFIATLLIPMRSDGILNIARWIPGLLYIFAAMLLSYDKVFAPCIEEEDFNGHFEQKGKYV